MRAQRTLKSDIASVYMAAWGSGCWLKKNYLRVLTFTIAVVYLALAAKSVTYEGNFVSYNVRPYLGIVAMIISIFALAQTYPRAWSRLTRGLKM